MATEDSQIAAFIEGQRLFHDAIEKVRLEAKGDQQRLEERLSTAFGQAHTENTERMRQIENKVEKMGENITSALQTHALLDDSRFAKAFMYIYIALGGVLLIGLLDQGLSIIKRITQGG